MHSFAFGCQIVLCLLVGELLNFSCSFFIHNSVFADRVDTSWRLEACGKIDDTMYPILALLKMLEIKPSRKVIDSPHLSNSCFAFFFFNYASVIGGCYI